VPPGPGRTRPPGRGPCQGPGSGSPAAAGRHRAGHARYVGVPRRRPPRSSPGRPAPAPAGPVPRPAAGHVPVPCWPRLRSAGPVAARARVPRHGPARPRRARRRPGSRGRPAAGKPAAGSSHPGPGPARPGADRAGRRAPDRRSRCRRRRARSGPAGYWPRTGPGPRAGSAAGSRTGCCGPCRCRKWPGWCFPPRPGPLAGYRLPGRSTAVGAWPGGSSRGPSASAGL